MNSKWLDKKPEAIDLRINGASIRDIETVLQVPKSTLSGWFKNIIIKPEYKLALEKRSKESLAVARKSAVLWHNKQKEARLIEAQAEATKILKKINCTDSNLIILALAMLYLGEGFKKVSDTGIGNSDPMILQFFIKILRQHFNVKIDQIRCYLHLRADQNPLQMKQYWSEKLDIPLGNFKGVSLDKRTKNSKTFEAYKGVCLVRCGNVAIQRKLVYLSKMFCKKIIK